MTALQSSAIVLVVEDEPLIRMAVKTDLEEAGFAVLEAETGDEAIDLLHNRISQIAAVVTDIRMPGRNSGWDVGRRARELNPTVTVVYVTGDSAESWSAQGVPDSQVLQKPFASAQLITAITMLLNAVSNVPMQPAALHVR
jgi:CheY-like chemotaxis protein